MRCAFRLRLSGRVMTMKISFGELVFLAIFMLLAVVIVHVNLLPAASRVRSVYQAQQLAEERAFCKQQSQRLPVAWDEDTGCILAEGLVQAQED